MKVKLYVEGGGDRAEQKARCREGFRKLLENAGFTDRRPTIVACGGREKTFDLFRTAVRNAEPDVIPMLLVDSEEPVRSRASKASPASAWLHLKMRDGWERPAGVNEDQAHLMVTCMETWIMADHAALRQVFAPRLREQALLPSRDLESRTRDAVQQALHDATRDCGRDRMYQKGRRSFQVLGRLDADTLKLHLLHFRRLVTALAQVLNKPPG